MAGCTVLFGKQQDHYPYNDDFTRKCAKQRSHFKDAFSASDETAGVVGRAGVVIVA